MSEFNIVADVAEVPKVERAERESKYAPVFPKATESKTGIIGLPFESEKQAQSRCNYIRRVAPKGFEVEQRGDTVFITDTKTAAAASKAAAKSAA